ncbi:unnamed protein product [Urochloa humidicola]
MGAERAWRWKLLPSFRSLSLPPASPSKPNKRRPPPPDVPLPPSSPAARKEPEPEEVPPEFLCPILRAPMADPVILPSGKSYERACVRACADLGLSLSPDGVAAAPAEGNVPGAPGGVAVAIPNDALRAAVRTWCARSGRAPPVPPSDDTAREAVLRAVPAPRAPDRAASNLSSSSDAALAPARSASNLSCSSEGASAASTSSSSSSSGRSSREMAAGEVEVARRNAPAKEQDNGKDKDEETARVVDAEAEAVVRAVEAGDEDEVEAAMSALRRATRECPARRRTLCASPRLLASLRRVLLSSRHTAMARADAAASLANLTLEPENRVPLVRAGAVPALVDAVSSSATHEAREHAAGALFGLALHEGNRAAIGVLGAVPPLLALLSGGRDEHAELPPRARRDAGMALYHLTLAAVNQSKLARAPGGARTLLAVASDGGEPAHIRRLALMVACNVAGCAEGRAALMDAGAVAVASAILSATGGGGGDGAESELQEWCVAALYAMSRGSPRFRGLARAAGADRTLMLVAEQASPGVHKEMAEAALRTILGLTDNRDDDDQISECRSSDGNRGGGRVVHRRRVASWSAPPPATPACSHQWRSVCID